MQWRAVADQIRPKVPKLETIMDEAEHDMLAYMSFPKEHRAKLHSTNPIERLNGEIKRRTDVVQRCRAQLGKILDRGAGLPHGSKPHPRDPGRIR